MSIPTSTFSSRSVSFLLSIVFVFINKFVLACHLCWGKAVHYSSNSFKPHKTAGVRVNYGQLLFPPFSLSRFSQTAIDFHRHLVFGEKGQGLGVKEMLIRCVLRKGCAHTHTVRSLLVYLVRGTFRALRRLKETPLCVTFICTLSEAHCFLCLLTPGPLFFTLSHIMCGREKEREVERPYVVDVLDILCWPVRESLHLTPKL